MNEQLEKLREELNKADARDWLVLMNAAEKEIQVYRAIRSGELFDPKEFRLVV